MLSEFLTGSRIIQRNGSNYISSKSSVPTFTVDVNHRTYGVGDRV